VSVGFPAAEELACQVIWTVRWQIAGLAFNAMPSAITIAIRFMASLFFPSMGIGTSLRGLCRARKG
jgi:hypothetical protein